VIQTPLVTPILVTAIPVQLFTNGGVATRDQEPLQRSTMPSPAAQMSRPEIIATELSPARPNARGTGTRAHHV
jgi:hypothetical protein